MTSLQSRRLALAALSMGFSMISSAFGFYYVKVFLNIYHIQEAWFQVAQTLFLVWNAINDPLFAYCQDSTNFRFTRTRRESVLYAAPLFALSFLVPWFPWGNPKTVGSWVTGIHLITALCFWDTMFTYVGLASCCLFTEITKDNKERLIMVRYNQIGSLIGSSSVFILQYMSDQLENFQTFQVTCVAVSVASCLAMRYCGKHAHTEQDLKNQNDAKCGQPTVGKSQEYSYISLTKQIVCNKDFICFVIMNFFQEFHRAFMSNFLAIFSDQLIVKGTISTFVRSAFYGASSSSSYFVVIFGAHIVGHFGYYKVIRYSQVFMISYALIYFMIGPINHWCLMLFLLVDRCLTDSVYSLFNLSLSDIADNDFVRYKRRHPVTSMVYGCNALVVKPAISLSPMFVVKILNTYGYEDLKNNTLDPIQHGTLNSVMFSLICLYPLVIGCIQFCSWSFYTIREKKTFDLTLVISEEDND